MNKFDLNISKQVLDSALAYLAYEMRKAIKESIGSITLPDTSRQIEAQTRVLSTLISNLGKKDDPKELAEIVALLKKQKPTDFKGVEKLLTELAGKKDDSKPILAALASLTEAVNKMQGNKPIKIDEMQMKALTTSQIPLMTNGGNLAARSATVTNTSLSSANTEYSYTFPANTVNFVIKLRAQNVVLLYSWTTGKLPTSGDGTAYMTAPQGFIRGQNDLDVSGKTIYLQTASSSQTAEIEVFKAT